MVDADLTYDFEEIPRFVEELDDGGELVMGNRMENIQPGAMPWMNRYIGNPLLSGFLKLLYRTPVQDAHCGMRAVRRDVLPRLDLRSGGMEFASEMVIRASKADLDVARVPDRAPPARRRVEAQPVQRRLAPPAPDAPVQPELPLPAAGPAHRARRRGRRWRRSSPASSLFGHTLLRPHADRRLAAPRRRHAAARLRPLRPDLRGEPPRRPRSLARAPHRPVPSRARPRSLGGGSRSPGSVLGGVVVGQWIASGLGSLAQERVTILAATLVIVGVQVFFTSFLLSILSLRRPALTR